MEKLKVLKFSLQIDEPTVNNSILLLAYVRYIDATAIYEEILFMKKLIHTRATPYMRMFMTTGTKMGFLYQICCKLQQTVPALKPASIMALLQN